MIKELFLPVTLGKKRVLSQRIVGYACDETRATAAVVLATSRKTFVEGLFSVDLTPGDDTTFKERAAIALIELRNKVGYHQHVRISIPASLVTLKEIKVPFVDYDRIKMVIEYEVEAMLPFSLDEAVIDFIVTETYASEQSSQVLVAAVRTQDLESVVDIYTTAGIKIQDITIDLFALYGLYEQIPEYQEIPQATALIDIGSRTTRIAFLYHGELRFMRTLQKGISSVAKHIADDTGRALDAVMAHLQQHGSGKTDDEKFNQSVEKHFINFLHEIQFTLNSFSLKLNYYDNINRILFTGLADLFPGFVEFCSTVLQTPCELFSGEKLLANPLIKNNIVIGFGSWSTYLIALGTAIVYPDHYEFNLRRKAFADADYELSAHQIMTAIGLTGLLMSFIVVQGYLQISNLSATAQLIEKKEIDRLKPLFADNPKALAKKNNFKKIVSEAEGLFNDRQEAWNHFSHVNLTPIEIIHGLTKVVDRRLWGVTLDSVSMNVDDNNNTIVTVEGLIKSPTGENHFAHFAEWYQRGFMDSHLFKPLTDPDLTDESSDRGGVKFSVKLRLKTDETA